jgi:hypothetical protein
MGVTLVTEKVVGTTVKVLKTIRMQARHVGSMVCKDCFMQTLQWAMALIICGRHTLVVQLTE